MRYIGQPRRMRANRFRLPQGDARIANLGIGLLAAPLDPRITFTRASTGTYFDAAGVMQTAAVDAPRFDHDPVTLAPKGLLIEGARTNLLLHSSDFSDAVWSKTAASVSADSVTGPGGPLTADSLIESIATSEHGLTQAVTFANATAYTAVFAVKSNGRNLRVRLPSAAFGVDQVVRFDLSSVTATVTGGTPTATITHIGGGYYLCTTTATTTAASAGNVSLRLLQGTMASYTGDGVSGVYLGFGQLEAGAFATSYIATTAASVTSAADVATVTGANFSNWYNASEGTFVIEASTISDFSAGLFAVQVAGITSFMQVTRQFSKATALVNTAGVDQATLITANDFASGAMSKSALAYAANDFALALNGGAVVTDAAGTVPTVDRLILGAGGFSSPLYGHLRRLDYYRTRLSNSELQRLTT